jgi:SAM-dependent methyltransferase
VGEAHEYILANAADDVERRRLRALERSMDPWTFSHLEAIGVAPGWRCLEVGGGGGSVARWLADRVGPAGTVLVTDLNPRFLVDLPTNVEVRRHDLLHDELELDAYDLVHCRGVLAHLRDPMAALRRMTALLASGGWLITEEPDYGLLTVVGHPDAAIATRYFDDVFTGSAKAGVMDVFLGRKLPGLMFDLDLIDFNVDATTVVAKRGDDAYEIFRLGTQQVGASVTKFGVSEAAFQTASRILDDPSAWMLGITTVAAWGRKR